MSESIKIDNSTIITDPEVKDTPLESETPSLVESSNNKRRLDEEDEHLDGDDDDEETTVRSSRKKFCSEIDTLIESEKDVMQLIFAFVYCSDAKIIEFINFLELRSQ